MLPDPPQKKGFYTDVPDNKTFVKWDDMSNYQTKIDKLNMYLEKQQDIRQKEMYRNLLDDIVRQKQLTKQEKNNSQKNYKDQTEIERIENQQIQQENKFKQQYIEANQKIYDMQKQKRQKYKQLEIEKVQQELKESQALNELRKKAQTERVKKNFLEFDQIMKTNQKLRKKQQEEQQLQEKQFDQAEKKHIKKIMENNQRFIDNVKKYQKSNDLTYDQYKAIYDQKEHESELFLKNFVDRKYQQRQQEEMEREQFDRSKRKDMQKENRNFLLNQIENNLVKNKVENFNKNKDDFVHMHQSMLKQEQQTKREQEQRKKLYKDNLTDLMQQIHQKKKSQSTNYMSKTEARHNNHSVVRLDFENPSTDLIGGIPGFSKPYERTHQLQIIENNLKNSQYRIDQLTKYQQRLNNQNNKINFSTFKKDYLSKFQNDQDNSKKVNFENEYQFIRHKNTTKPFNIISGQLKGYETFRQLIQLQ